MTPTQNCPLQNAIGAKQMIGTNFVESPVEFLLAPYLNIVTD
jgi:hypothetical protein